MHKVMHYALLLSHINKYSSRPLSCTYLHFAAHKPKLQSAKYVSDSHKILSSLDYLHQKADLTEAMFRSLHSKLAEWLTDFPGWHQANTSSSEKWPLNWCAFFSSISGKNWYTYILYTYTADTPSWELQDFTGAKFCCLYAPADSN